MIDRIKIISLAALGAVALSTATARAQQPPPDAQQGQQPSEPIPAIRSPLAGAAGDVNSQDSQDLSPDTRSLTGVEDLSLGTLPESHSYWQPHISILGTVDSNPQHAGSTDWLTWTSLIAGV